MLIYIDINDGYKCYTSNNSGTLLACETDFFDGKCQVFIEGYRYVPAPYAWTREDGEVFTGEMITPWKDYALLEAAQAGYEESHASASTAYEEGVNSI